MDMPRLLLILTIPLASGLAQLPGRRPDGSVLLPNQWSLRPAGQQIELGDFPVNIAMHPKSRYAAATPMLNSFQPEPDLRTYDALPARVDVDERNSKTSWGERESRKMDFTKEDAADDFFLNAVIWRAVRGEDSRMPTPTRAGFVFVHTDKDND